MVESGLGDTQKIAFPTMIPVPLLEIGSYSSQSFLSHLD